MPNPIIIIITFFLQVGAKGNEARSTTNKANLQADGSEEREQVGSVDIFLY